MKILVDGQMLEYSDEGSGPVVVMLHGWGTSLSTFDNLTKKLTEKFRVIRLDFPGFGASPKPTGDWNVGDYGRLVSGLIAKLKIGKVHAVIGHSFGGRVIIKGVADGNLNPEKVVLIGSAGVKMDDTVRRSLFATAAKLGRTVTILPGLKQLRPALKKRLYRAAGSSDYVQAADMKKIFLNTINEDLLPYVHQISQPTLLIWGEQDTETPVADAYKMMNELPNGSLSVIPEVGHFVYLVQPQKVDEALELFL
jgi:pimeloyl-ACP methyl ester carboxylesterase